MIAPTKDDLICQVRKDLDDFNIELTDSEISRMKKETFKNLMSKSKQETIFWSYKILTQNLRDWTFLWIFNPIWKVQHWPFMKSSSCSSFAYLHTSVKVIFKISTKVISTANTVTLRTHNSIFWIVVLLVILTREIQHMKTYLFNWSSNWSTKSSKSYWSKKITVS